MPVEELDGLRKAAVLLVQVGKERSAQVLRSLREPEIEELTAEIARMKDIDADTVDAVLGEFQQLAAARHFYGQGGLQYAEEVLLATLGPEKTHEIMDRLTRSLVQMPFEFLRRVNPTMVLSFLQEEHPQTIALVLAHMTATQAAIVLSGLSDALQADVAHRLAIMDRTSPEIVKQVEAHMQRRLSSVLQPSDYASVGGLTPLVDIINHSDRATELLILAGLEERDRDLAEEVRARMFMFEDVQHLDDRSVQLILRGVDVKDLAMALKGMSEEVRDKITTNMSERAGLTLREDMEVLGPVRAKQVQEAQAVVIRHIRSLEEAGDIVISRGSDDDFIL